MPRKRRWAEVETNCGTEFVPLEQLGLTLPDGLEACAELLLNYLEGNRVFSVQEREGYGVRLSALGYLDCTEWAVFDTEEEARAYLEETYGEEGRRLGSEIDLQRRGDSPCRCVPRGGHSPSARLCVCLVVTGLPVPRWEHVLYRLLSSVRMESSAVGIGDPVQPAQ